MKKTIYMCDCCGKTIEAPDWFTVFYGITSSESNVTKTEKLFDDICSNCMNNLRDILHSGELIRKPVAPQKAAPAKRQPFDEGKARALRNAGWSLEKIADEMKCSPQTVANHLAKSPPEEAA